MPNFVAALSAVLLSLLGFLPQGFGPAVFDTARSAALAVLTVYLAWQAYALLRQRTSAPVPTAGQAAQAMGAGAAAAAGSASVAPAKPLTPTPAAAPVSPSGAGGDALILLSLLQDRGRFLDFVAEDISAYSDGQVAAASRVVHQGCKSVINECLALAPAHAGAEGDRITVDPATDPNRYRLQGKLAQQPPYSGVVVHRGWKTMRLTLPRHTRPIDPSGENIVAPIDVEVR